MAEGVTPGTITIEVDFSHIPVRPTSQKEIRELEIALIIGTLFRPEVIKSVTEPKEFTTWVDSLAVAAGALARDKAGYPVSKIADELGRTEATIRRHLSGETKAGQLVKETYEMLVRGKLKLEVPAAVAPREEVEKLKKELEEYKSKVEELENTVKNLRDAVTEAKAIIAEARSTLEKAEEVLSKL
jgi:probable regulatory domain-containing protein